MIRARRRPEWPFGPDTAEARAKVIARFCWHRLDELDPAFAEQIRAMAAPWGDDLWLTPQPDTTQPGQPLGVAQVAERAGVLQQTVTMWGSRGIVRGGIRHRLVKHPAGYDLDEVDEFLRLRHHPDTSRTPPAAQTRPEEPAP